MKTLAKHISIFLILVPIAIGITALSVDAQTKYIVQQYEFKVATYYYGDLFTDFHSGEDFILKTLDGESLVTTTLISTFTKEVGKDGEEDSFLVIKLQTLASYDENKKSRTKNIEWYTEKIIILNAYEENGGVVFFGYRENGEYVFFTDYKSYVVLQFTNEEKNTTQSVAFNK